MNEKLEQIFELPGRTKVGILIGSLAVLGAGYWFLFSASDRQELTKLAEQIDGDKGLRARISQKEGIVRNLPKYKEEVEKLDQELAKALRELPDKREIYLLLDTVSDKARDSGLEVPLFRPQSEQKKDFYAEVPVEIEVRGTYHQVATFFDEVGQLERIVNVDDFGMAEPSINEKEVNIRVALVATTFRFIEESERPQNEEGSGKKGKKRRKKKEAQDG